MSLKKPKFLNLCLMTLTALATIGGNSYPASAAVFDTKTTPNVCPNFNTNLICLLFVGPMSTTSLPSIIVDGEEMDLSSSDATERFQAELRGDVDPAITSVIAHQLHMTLDEVRSVALEMTNQGQKVTPQSVAKSIASRK